MKNFNGVIKPGDYDIYVGDEFVWEVLLTEKITGDKDNGGGRLTMKPGAVISPYTRKDLEELWFVLSGGGEFAVWSEDGNTQERRTVRPHSLIYIRKGQRHEIKNNTSELLRFLVFFPASGPELTFLNCNEMKLFPAAKH